MRKLRKSPAALLGLLALVVAIEVLFPHQGLGQDGPTKLICDLRPCDAEARGKLAFNDRRLSGLDGNGRSCVEQDCPILSQ